MKKIRNKKYQQGGNPYADIFSPNSFYNTFMSGLTGQNVLGAVQSNQQTTNFQDNPFSQSLFDAVGDAGSTLSQGVENSPFWKYLSKEQKAAYKSKLGDQFSGMGQITPNMIALDQLNKDEEKSYKQSLRLEAQDLYRSPVQTGMRYAANMAKEGGLQEHPIKQVHALMGASTFQDGGRPKNKLQKRKDNYDKNKPKPANPYTLTAYEPESKAEKLYKALVAPVSTLDNRANTSYEDPSGLDVALGVVNPFAWIEGARQVVRSTGDIITGEGRGSDYATVGLTAAAAALGLRGSSGKSLTSKVTQMVNDMYNPAAGLRAVTPNSYVDQTEAVTSRANRLLSQQDKWVGQSSDELVDRLTNAPSRHNPASDYSAEKLGVNRGSSTEVSANANITNANKARVAAHETGHYYRNAPEEAEDWLSAFDVNKLDSYLRGKPHRTTKMVGDKFESVNLSRGHADELRERAAQLKDFIAERNGIPLSQNFNVTRSQLDDALKNYTKSTGLDNSMTKFISAIKDRGKLLSTMNKYALGATGVAAVSQQMNGGIAKYQNGATPKLTPQDASRISLEVMDKYNTETEARQEALRAKLASTGADNESIDRIIQIVYDNINPNESGVGEDVDARILRNPQVIEQIKNETGVFIPDFSEEIQSIIDLEKGHYQTQQDLRAIRDYEEEMAPQKQIKDDKKFKYLEQGGNTSMQQQMGYKDNSPYRHLPYQTFNTDTLTMGVENTKDSVSIPILAIADNGMKKVLFPNSGLHKFAGAKKITEIPMAEEGGNVEQQDGGAEEMIEGIIEILTQIQDPNNRQQIAIQQLEELREEGVQIDEKAFMAQVMGVEEMKEGGMPDRYKALGFSSVNTPKRTPSHDSKSHAVVVKDDGDYKLIRFGQQGVSGSPKREGESEADRNRRESFKARHADNIARGKTSASYWSNKVKWNDGGQPKITNTVNLTGQHNPFSQQISGYFRQGGIIAESNPWKNPQKQPITGATTTGPMGKGRGFDPDYQNKGLQSLFDIPKNDTVPVESLIPIQAEVDELIVMPTGDITKVMATKRHHKMSDDVVTDVVPENAYILSAHGQVKINRDEARNFIVEMGLPPYRVGTSQYKPTEKRLSDIMTKKVMSPAEIGKMIEKKFPITSTSNPFELLANNENKINRKPYLEGIIQLSEIDRYRKGLNLPEQLKNGGMVIRRDYMQDGGGTGGFDPTSMAIQAGTSLLNGVVDYFGARAQRKAADKAYGDVVGMAESNYNTNVGNTNAAAGIQLMSIGAQNPVVTPTRLYAPQQQIPIGADMYRSVANYNLANLPTYERTANSFYEDVVARQAAYSKGVQGAGQTLMSGIQANNNQYNQYIKDYTDFLNKDSENKNAASNATRINTNTQIGSAGQVGSNYFGNLSTLNNNLYGTKINARLGQLPAQLQQINAGTQAISGAITDAGVYATQRYGQPQTQQNNTGQPVQIGSTTCIGGKLYMYGSNGFVDLNQTC